MDDKDLPENIRRAIDIVAAIIRRIQQKALDNESVSCLYMTEAKGLAT